MIFATYSNIEQYLGNVQSDQQNSDNDVMTSPGGNDEFGGRKVEYDIMDESDMSDLGLADQGQFAAGAAQSCIRRVLTAD